MPRQAFWLRSLPAPQVMTALTSAHVHFAFRAGRSRLTPSSLPRTMASARSSQPAVSSSSGLPYGYVPAYLPGSASLVEQLDQELLIVLRDGRHLVGVRANTSETSVWFVRHREYSHDILFWFLCIDTKVI